MIDNEQDISFENSNDVHDDAYSDEFTKSYNDDDALKKVRDIVSKLRKIMKHIKKSTKCKEFLEKTQKTQQQTQVNKSRERILKVSLDIRTRWNSTLKMLMRSLALKDSINSFLKYCMTPDGEQEFIYAKTKMDLLGSFDYATKVLSSEKYSSFVTTFPALRFIQDTIGNKDMFQFSKTSSKTSSNAKPTFKTNFYGKYGNFDFFQSVVNDLNSCGLLLLKEFNDRFKEMDPKNMWPPLLDPRFNLKSIHWKDNDEKELVKKLLNESVENIVVKEALEKHRRTLEIITNTSESKSENENEIDFFEENEYEHVFDLFG